MPEIESISADDYAVVELSSFQLISMRKGPDVAVVTNVAPNHLDVHKDMQEYIDAKKKGAHAEEYIIKPDVEFFLNCNESCGDLIRLVTIAPNMDGAIEFIRRLSDKSIISLGHTSADYATSRKAIEAGAHHITHIYNAMMPLEHRAPGLIGAAAEDEYVMAELICAGVHVH